LVSFQRELQWRDVWYPLGHFQPIRRTDNLQGTGQRPHATEGFAYRYFG
jgi:hypothetical protein